MDKFTALWTLLAIILGVVEASTMGLVCIWLCIAAVVAALVSLVTSSLWIQFVVFVIVAAVLLAATRPFVKRFVEKDRIATNADAVIGCHGIVIADINPAHNVGQVKVNGQIWSAKADKIIPEGAEVKVKAISGVKVIVTEI